MTIEELLESKDRADYFRSNLEVIPVNLLNEFLESNVCIPKGENRHKDVDELHKALELNDGFELEFSRDGKKWIDAGTMYMPNPQCSYRFKPSKPVYEWQCYRVCSGQVYIIYRDTTSKDPSFYTLEEMKHVSGAIAVEQTKRERK